MNPPTDFLCPITKKLMKDPVLSVQGISFERAAILEWLDSHDCCPVRLTPLKAFSLRTNTKLQWEIRYWESKHLNDDEEEDHQEISSESRHDTSIKRFLCPLNNQVMEDPVTTRDGHSYDRRVLLRFFQKHGEISPFSGKPFREPSFYANKKLGWEIRHWKESLRLQNNAGPPAEPATTSVQEEVKSKPQEKTAETKTYTITIPPKKLSADVPRSSVSSHFLHSQIPSNVGGDKDVLTILNEVRDLKI
jgi:hypothetical protein